MNTVADIMTTGVVSVRPELPLYDLICLLVDRNVSGVPVVDALGRAIGMVSRADLLSEDYEWAEVRDKVRGWGKIAGKQVAEDEDLFSDRTLAGKTVADVMTTVAVSVLPTASVREASQVMINHHVHRLAVVDESAKMVGIVTTFDITRWASTH